MESVLVLFISFYFSVLSFIPLLNSTSKDLKIKKKPNILILLADDMGYAELGCYGGISHTPNLDKLAQKGIRFSDFYAGAPNCSPSRSALLTGKSPVRTGMYNYRPPGHPMHLQRNELTLANLLKTQGYQTALFGKWHLGCLPQDEKLNQPQPDDHGFDFYFATENNAEPSHFNPVNFVKNGKMTGNLNGYSCQLVADEAISWIEKSNYNRDPFFMYVAFHEPHASTQWTAPPELVNNYNQFPEREANCYANVQNLDSAAGRIINHLIDKNLFDNTIIIFASDNGSYRHNANGKLKAVKSYLYEGGIRVPAIVHWPSLISKPGALISQPAGLIDIMPTLNDFLEIQTEEKLDTDGTSILSLLEGKNFVRSQPLYWFFYRTSPEIAVRVDNYMIMGKDEDMIPRTHEFSAPDMLYIKNMTIKDYELYDLTNDISQSKNILNECSDADSYKKQIDKKLEEIQEKGYYWDNLPLLENKPKQIKTNWVKLK